MGIRAVKSVISIITALAFALAIASAQPVYAQSPTSAESMKSANDLYNIERYQEAAQSYERLVGLGYDDKDLFYNLGNAYYKQDDVGRAVLNYLRAQRLAPRDEDIKVNLAFAREQTADALEPIEFGGPLASFARAIPFASTNTAAVLLLILWATIAGSVAWWLAKPTPRTRLTALVTIGAAGLLMTMFAVVLAGNFKADSAYSGAAIIVVNEVKILSGPGPQYTEEFTLHSGAETSLIEIRRNWTRISVPATDLQGWVPRRAVEPVVPRAS